MFKTLMPATLLALCCLALPACTQDKLQSDSDYLQDRAASLNLWIDKQARANALTQQQAEELRLSVGQVQTRAGNLQARNGTITRAQADALNQTLTDVERALRGED
ncbi:hypothetical protein [Pseudomonas phoenicis]|uniref:hypothetical protein n=1 Tax=unclassified Pseudomonas TaxID=196821 RepID=UPI00399F7CF0